MDEKHNNKTWVFLAVGASLLFTTCNEFIAEISAVVGPFSFFYFTAGGITSSLVYNLIKAY